MKISNCKFDSIGHIGFSITNGRMFSFSNYPNKDITIKNCEFSRVKGYNNATNPGTFTGIGIFLVAVDSAMVERNLVYSCGGLGYEGEGSGPDGIEAARCNKIVYQYNEVYDQKSSSETDGSGLHFGDGVQNSIIQYNYSHDNDGAGINCYSYDGNYPLSDSNNITRYNICAKNGRGDGDGHGEIEVGGSSPKTTYSIQIYNNTLYATDQNGNDRSVFMLYRNVNGITFRNNIVYSADTSVALFSHYPTGGTYSNIFIQNNVYWSDQQIFKFREGFSFYYDYLSWQTVTGFEKINGVNVGYTEDPMLVNPNDAGNVNNYKTNPGSVTVENGLNLNSMFGTTPGSNDFYGSSIPRANEFDIGAYEDTSVFVIVDLTILIEGFYNSISDTQIGDTVRLYLAESESPYNVVDVSKSYINTKGKGYFIFNADILVESGIDHYLVATHRNSIETWSSSPVNLHISGSRVYYNFTTDDSQAYGDNIVQKGSKWCIYGGDVNQDGVIDLIGDGDLVENAVNNIETGYVSTDLNGDQVVDIADLTIVESNSTNFIIIVKP
ncbi:MAG: hypothetical protein IPM96_20420 [Ignavibacteria bacterium]|nr:hypothetical protein [Ignavibacteria bacterium]